MRNGRGANDTLVVASELHAVSGKASGCDRIIQLNVDLERAATFGRDLQSPAALPLNILASWRAAPRTGAAVQQRVVHDLVRTKASCPRAR